MSFLASGFDSYADTTNMAELNNLMSKNDCTKQNNVFTVSYVEKALAVLKSGKASGFDGIVCEHLIYSHPSLLVCLVLLFNVMCYHGFVPDDFGVGITVPLVKDIL